MTQGPEAGASPSPESPKSPRDIMIGVTQAVTQLNKAGELPPEQRPQVVNNAVNAIVLGVAELHRQGEIGRNEKLRSYLQAQVFTAGSVHRVLAETLVAVIEQNMAKAADDPRAAHPVPSLLELSSLLGINNRDKYPDLAHRLETISAKINQPTAVGGREGGGEPPEGSKGHESASGPEWETSPERGRWLCDEIIRFRTTMTYKERYNEINGPIYAQRIKELEEFVDKLCEIRNDPDPFGPHKAFPKIQYRQEQGEPFVEFPPESQEMQELKEAIGRLRDRYQLEGAEESGQSAGFTPEALPTDNEGNPISVDILRGQYADPSSRQEFLNAQANLGVYFRQAKNYEFLKEVDTVLNSTYQEITRAGISPEQAEELLERGINRARRVALAEFRDKIMEDPDLPEQFTGVGNAYIDWANRRLERHLHGQSQLTDMEGEWFIPTPEQASKGSRKTYWETTSWPKYYHVTAQNPEQFLIARQTFFLMIRTAGLGRSPDAVFEHIQNFIEAFKGAGSRLVQEGKMSNEFLMENRLELEALLYVFVGNYSNEVYNHKRRKEAMMAMALDEGPARWVALYRGGKGKRAAFTQMFDMEDLMDIYNNPVGERGEMNIVTGHYLQDHIQEKVIERGMGIMLKDYDPRDTNLNSEDLQVKRVAATDLDRIKLDLGRIEKDISAGRIKLKKGETAISRLSERDQARYNAFKANSNRLGLTKSSEEFKALYEGFDNGDTHIKNYQNFREDQSKPQNQRKLPAFTALPEAIRKSIELGRVQVRVLAFREAIILGQIKPPRGIRAVDLLSPQDRQIYQAAYDEAAAEFDIASQMQGVLGEKARRGRGFLYVDRNDHIRYYYEVGDQLRLDKRDINKFTQEEFNELVAVLPEDRRKSFKIGWMLAKKRDGKPLETFPQEWRDFYDNKDNKLSPEDKLDFVDNLPVYQAENFVNWGIFWTKMRYADDESIWESNGGWKAWRNPIALKIREDNKKANNDEFANFKAQYRRVKVRETRDRLIKELRTEGYSAQLWDDEVGLDGKPKLMTFKRPLGGVDPNTGQFKKFNEQKDLFLGYDQNGQKVKLRLDEAGKLVGLQYDQSGKAVIYDTDNKDNRKRINDHLTKYSQSNKSKDGVFVEDAVATFQIAAQSSDFRNRYTDHTYWFYQGNNRVTILTPRIQQAAERIRDGLSRPEDEDILAIQRLIVDPTLRRIKKFPDVLQQREVALIGAAVLESFQDKQRTKHKLHNAFLPKDGFIGRMRAGYRNEDWAGYDRYTLGFEEYVAQQPLRFARRLGAEIAIAPFENDAAGPKWGVHGVGGAIRVMADEIKRISHQGIVGQFGLTKVFEAMDKAVDMFNACVGTTDPQTGEHIFGVFEKPTDNNETMHKYYKQALARTILSNPEANVSFLCDFLKCFGRLTKVTHIMRVMYSNIDNANGVLNLEEVDVSLPDGSFNTTIETDKVILGKNGIARNRQNAFLHGEEGLRGFFDWLIDENPGGGADAYKGEKYWNRFLDKKYAIYEGGQKATEDYQEVKIWVKDKII